MQTKDFMDACHFAHSRHKGQNRKYTGEPYYNHCISVARMVMGFTNDREVWIAAVLHDILEDTETTGKEIYDAFGERVWSMVWQLTDYYTVRAFPHYNRARRKELERERLARVANKSVKLIKYCDIVDNTPSIMAYDPKFAVIYLKEVSALIEVLGIEDLKRLGV